MGTGTTGAIHVCGRIVQCLFGGGGRVVGCGREHGPVHARATMTMMPSSSHPLWVTAGARGGTLLVFLGDGQWWELVLTSCPCLCRFLPSFLFYLPSSQCVGVACRLIRHMMGLLGWLDDE